MFYSKFRNVTNQFKILKWLPLWLREKYKTLLSFTRLHTMLTFTLSPQPFWSSFIGLFTLSQTNLFRPDLCKCFSLCMGVLFLRYPCGKALHFLRASDPGHLVSQTLPNSPKQIRTPIPILFQYPLCHFFFSVAFICYQLYIVCTCLFTVYPSD